MIKSSICSITLFVVLVLAAPSPLAAQVTVLDTIYTPANYPDTALAATIFIPDPSVAKGVGIVLGRGSGLTRLAARYWCDTLAARGYLAMTIDYYDLNVIPYGLYPKPVRAFKTAVEFLRRNADRFGISTGKIVGLGQSQGSIVWSQTITWDNDDAFFGTDPSIDDHLDAAILLYGAYDMFNTLTTVLYSWLTTHFSPDPLLRATKGQCISNVANITTPILLVHGSWDQNVNAYHSRILRDSLTYHGRMHQYVEFSGSRHAFDWNSSTGQFSSLGLVVKDTVLSFLARVLSPGPKGVISSPDVDFGSVQAGKSVDKTISIMNYGDDTLKILNITSSNPAFSATPTNGDIPPSKTFIDTLRFAATAIGTATGSLVIISNGALSSDTIKVSGIGNPPSWVEVVSSRLPAAYILKQNYPNPFNPSTKIQFSVVSRDFTVLKIYDVLGREAATLVNEELAPGIHEVSWDATGFSSGVYFYRLQAGEFVQTKKLLILR